MAGVDAIVSTLLKTVSQILVKETTTVLNATTQLELFQGELKFIMEFLRNSEGSRDKVKEVVKQIQDAALEAENLIDDFVVNMAKHKRRNTLQRFLHGGELIILLRSAAAKVKHIKNKINEIYANRDKYDITNSKGAVSKKSSIQSRRQNVEKEDVVCFDNEAELVIKKLDTWDSRRDVVSIIGMGGLGKTTLARKIFHGNFVKKFDCAAWVNVSQDYNHKDLLQKIAETVLPSMDMKEFKETNNIDESSTAMEETDKVKEEKLVQKLVQKLATVLASKRYLIVLDDVWEKLLWDEIKEALPENGKRSRVLITSRIKDVALHASTRTPPYFLPSLNEDDSWKLFSRKVFPDQVCPPKLEEIVRQQILTKCKGLPLAIVVVAGLLRKREESMWSTMAANLNWHMARDPTECLGILALSYEELPPYLKPCFLYFGVYPEDFEIPVRQLIRLWVAEGLLDQDNSNNSDMEDMAEEYLLELIDRSLIQVASRRTDGGVKSCRMHDLLRDLSISKGEEEKFLLLDRKVDGSLATTQPRRLCVHYASREIRYDYLSVLKISQLRSLLSFGDKDRSILDKVSLEKDPFSRLSKLCRYLRVLDLGSSRYYNFPPKVEKLVQLRYLRMNALNLHEILPPISKLVNLQTLDVRGSQATTFRANIWEMQQLRHLFLCDYLPTVFNIPKGNGNSGLLNLRTLSSLCLYREDDVDILKMFPNLKKLEVACYKEDLGVFEYLYKLQRLQTLKIEGRFRLTDPGALPLSLTKITLHNSYLDTSAFAKLGELPNLQVLKLRWGSLTGSKLECGSDQGLFPKLEVLHIDNLSIEWWSMEGQGFQSLVYLSIKECIRLKAIPNQLKQLHTLRQLIITCCPALYDSLRPIWANDARCDF